MNKLKELIENMTISKRELCNKAGITRPTLDNILSSQHPVRVLTIKKICKALDVDWKDYI